MTPALNSSAEATTTTVNDNTTGTADNRYEYVGSWSYGPQSGAYQNDNHWSKTANAYYQVRFNGTQIAVYGAKDPGHGIAAVSIDGGEEVLVDCYSSTRQEQALLYTSSILVQGSHTIRVRVTGTKNSSSSNTWIPADKVVITTDGTPVPDALGMVVIPRNQLSVTATSQQAEYEAFKAFDGNRNTLWKASGTVPQSITISLGGTYSIGKMDYSPDITTSSGRFKKFRILTSTDGFNFTQILESEEYGLPELWTWDYFGVTDCKAVIYFDLPVQASHVKFEFLTTKDGTPPCASEINVYKYPTPPELTPGPGPVTTTPVTNPNLSLASQVLIEKGLQIHSWIAPDKRGRGFPTTSEFNGLNMTGITYYDPPLYNSTFHAYNPGAQWNLAKAPFCTNAVGQNPTGNGDYLSVEQKANINQLVSVCFGDEQGYSIAEEGYLKNWFAASKQLYPRVLVHTNQYLGQWSSSQLDSYIKNAKPDILTFDNYYCDQNGSIKDYDLSKKVLEALNYQRPKALSGIDGTGTKPIAFGQYIGCYKIGSAQYQSGWYEYTESQKYLITNLTWAMGGKWLDMFRTEYDPMYQILFGEDRWPTHHYYEFAELFRQSRNLGPHLVRLNNIDVRVQPGQYMSGSTIVTNTAPSGWSLGAFTANTEYHISNISATNLGTENKGLRGDVVIGYFKPLPGLDTTTFFTSLNPKYFMVVNGLTSGNGLRPENQHGSLNETKQKITLTFKNPTILKKVSRDTGAIETVTLTPAGSNYTLDITLGGGETELFYWEE